MPLSVPCVSGPGILVCNPLSCAPTIKVCRVGTRSTSRPPPVRQPAAQWHEALAKLHLSVVYVPGKDSTVANCLNCWAYPAGKAWMDISMHGDAEETAEANRIIEAERLLEEGETECFVVIRCRAELVQV